MSSSEKQDDHIETSKNDPASPAVHYNLYTQENGTVAFNEKTRLGNLPNPLEKASLWSMASLTWVQPVISLGAKQMLELEDVWPIAKADSCEYLHDRFIKNFHEARKMHQSKQLKKKDQESSKNKGFITRLLHLPYFARALVRTFRYEYFLILLAFLVYLVAMAMQTYLAQAILYYLNDEPNFLHIQEGVVLVAFLTISSIVSIISMNFSAFVGFRTGVNMRTIVMDMVYQHALKLSNAARQACTTGDIMTLMSVDSDRIFLSGATAAMMVLSPVTFILTIVLIAFLFDTISALIGGTVLVIVITSTMRISTAIGATQGKLLQAAGKRVKLTSEALQGIRVMKFYAWEDAVADRISTIRKSEVALYRQFHLYQVVNQTLLFLVPVLISGATLGSYILLNGSDNVTVTDVFTLIAIVNISTVTTTIFPRSIAAFSQAMCALDRLEKFLDSETFDVDEMRKDQIKSLQDAKSSNSIICENSTFQWQDAETNQVGFELKNINLNIPKGSLVMIVGRVGSGKSSLLMALLGEMKCVNGYVSVDKNNHEPNSSGIAYIGQESWIRNATVKNNILFEQHFDKDAYDLVLSAAQLKQDLKSLPDDDRTEIGERGINVSGGQKARIAIARAMYRIVQHEVSPSIIMMDDPLSAVDYDVAQRIFSECVMNLAKDTTRLLVMNSHYELLTSADHVIVMGDNGSISGQGTPDEVLKQFPEYQIHSHQRHREDNTTKEDRESLTRQSTKNASGTLVQKEDRVKGLVSSSTYKTYFSQTGVPAPVIIGLIIVAYAVGHGVRVLVDWWQAHWASSIEKNAQESVEKVDTTFFGLYYAGLIALCCVLTIGRGWFILEVCLRSSLHLHDVLLRRVFQAPVNLYFDITPVGRILNRFSSDLDQMDARLPQLYIILLQALVTVIGGFIVCAAAAWEIAVTFIPVAFMSCIVGIYYKRTARELKRLDGITRSPVFSLFGETLNGLTQIRAFNLSEKFALFNRKAVDHTTTYNLTFISVGRWLAITLDVISVAVIFCVALILVFTKDSIGSVMAGLSLTYSLLLTNMVQWTVRGIDDVDNGMTSVERLLHFKNIPVEEISDNTISKVKVDPNWPLQGAIEFRNVYLQYRPELPYVLRGVNLTIEGGEKIGICGRTGAGKSSLITALFRMGSMPDEGELGGSIIIDGVDVAKISLQSLRSQLAIIPQDPVLFSGTLRDNLDPQQKFGDDALWQVLKYVHLSDFLSSESGRGLNMAIAESGDNLSVGQRQLVCIARALLKDCKIVVMDEATANVDSITDTIIQDMIQESFKDKTVMIIAHRLNTIMHCDKLVVMDSGKVLRVGTPSEITMERDEMLGLVQS